MHVQMAGGGFVGSSVYVVDASHGAKAARAAGIAAPVRTLWCREDDIKGGYYRPMHVLRANIGFDERGIDWMRSRDQRFSCMRGAWYCLPTFQCVALASSGRLWS